MTEVSASTDDDRAAESFELAAADAAVEAAEATTVTGTLICQLQNHFGMHDVQSTYGNNDGGDDGRLYSDCLKKGH